jgi:hypothetical protein
MTPEEVSKLFIGASEAGLYEATTRPSGNGFVGFYLFEYGPP